MNTKSILRKFGRKVYDLRCEKGWSQEELAKRADLHRTYIGAIERQERNVSLLNVERIAMAFNVDVKDLLD